MNKIKAFAPGNVSCVFSIYEHKNPAKMGSLGVGFTVNEGAIVSIKKIPIKKNKMLRNSKGISGTQKFAKQISCEIKNKTIVYFNNKKINFPTVESVVKKLNKKNKSIEIKIKSKLPLGCGFGLSGASALATAYALNKLFNLKKNKKELAKIAHVAEVENRTGLGDVVNQYYGGFLVKFEPSSKFIVKKLPIKNKTVYYKVFSGLNTKKIISNEKIKDKINKAGIDSLNKIKKIINNKNIDKKDILKMSEIGKPISEHAQKSSIFDKIIKTQKNPKDFLCPRISLSEILRVSKNFSIESGLLKNKNLKNLIKKIEKDKGNASMIMLGNAVFSDKKFEGCKRVKIVDKGAYVL